VTEGLQKILHEEIPLTREMGIKVVAHDEGSLTLSAPLEPNINHKRTAFGGSLYSVSVLSGWGLIYLVLNRQELNGHIVIQESNTRFLAPVSSEIIATSSFDSQEQLEQFLQMYRRKGIARIQLSSSIESMNRPAVSFSGRYVVHS